MKKTTKIIALVILVVSTTSCLFDSFTGIKGNGNIRSEQRTIETPFDAIDVGQGIHVFLTQSSEQRIDVEADENIINLLKTEVKGHTLHIFLEKNVYRAAARNVYVNTSKIIHLATSSGARIQTGNTVKTDDLELDASSGSSMKLKITAQNIQCETSSGADIRIEGTTTFFQAKASSGSTIYASNMESENTTAKVSSGANMDVYASESLTAKASSGGDIDYAGNPKVIDKDTSSGGSVSKY